MSTFRIGQRVVCINGRGWHRSTPRVTGWWLWKKTVYDDVPGPKKYEVVTVLGTNSEGFLFLAEYLPFGCYDPAEFRPLDPLEEQLQRIESEGCPTTEPQPQTA